MYNTTILPANRWTYLKIVLIALIASIAAGLAGLRVHVSPANSEAMLQQRAGAS